MHFLFWINAENEDIHVDPNYLAGTSPKKHCHRKSKHEEKNTAGKFGALSSACDSPLSLVRKKKKTGGD